MRDGRRPRLRGARAVLVQRARVAHHLRVRRRMGDRTGRGQHRERRGSGHPVRQGAGREGREEPAALRPAAEGPGGRGRAHHRARRDPRRHRPVRRELGSCSPTRRATSSACCARCRPTPTEPGRDDVRRGAARPLRHARVERLALVAGTPRPTCSASRTRRWPRPSPSRARLAASAPIPTREGDLPAVLEAADVEPIARSCSPSCWRWNAEMAASVRCTTIRSRSFERCAERGVPTALVSNCSHNTRPIVDRLGLEREFDAVILSFEVGAMKPDPAIYREALARLGDPDPGALGLRRRSGPLLRRRGGARAADVPDPSTRGGARRSSDRPQRTSLDRDARSRCSARSA